MVHLISSLPPQTDITFPMIRAALLLPWAAAQPHPMSSLSPVVLLRLRLGHGDAGWMWQIFVHPRSWWVSSVGGWCFPQVDLLPSGSGEPGPHCGACSDICCVEIREVLSDLQILSEREKGLVMVLYLR